MDKHLITLCWTKDHQLHGKKLIFTVGWQKEVHFGNYETKPEQLLKVLPFKCQEKVYDLYLVAKEI